MPASAAAAEPSVKKSIWGPVERNGVSQFPIYRELGVGIFQTSICVEHGRADAARQAHAIPATRPTAGPPRSTWRSRRARRHGIAVSILLNGAPGWANGGRARDWAPDATRATSPTSPPPRRAATRASGTG